MTWYTYVEKNDYKAKLTKVSYPHIVIILCVCVMRAHEKFPLLQVLSIQCNIFNYSYHAVQ